MESLLRSAILAPSGDNTQPCRYTVDDTASTVTLSVDPARDPSPMNCGQTMARIAVGASLENLLRTAERNGLGYNLSVTGNGEPVVQFPSGSFPTLEIDPAVPKRVTNRKLYDARILPDDIRQVLVDRTGDLDGVSSFWISDRDRIASLADIIAQGDAYLFSEPRLREAFLENVRFDASPSAEVDHGLSLGSLEVSRKDRIALRAMRFLPDWVLRLGGASKVFAGHARSLVGSASALCFITAPDREPRTDYAVGRAMQRAWLAITEAGLSAQPMMSLPVLDNVLEHGDASLATSLRARGFATLMDRFRSEVTEIGESRIAFVLRCGFASPPTGRTGRLPLDELVDVASPQESPSTGPG